MKLTLKTIMCGIGLAFLTVQPINNASAQDIIVNDGLRGSVIRGTITDIFYDEFTLKIDENTDIRVDIDRLDIDDNNFADFFPIGSHVTVSGNFDDDEFIAQTLMIDTE